MTGEKGTGKTAYAVYLSNNDFEESLGSIKFLRETDYKKFIELKSRHQLVLSDYCCIWKVIIYMLIAYEIKRCLNYSNPIKAFYNYQKLTEAIDDYYEHAFSPEIVKTFEFIQNVKDSLKIISKYFEGGGSTSETVKFTDDRFQVNLLYLQNKFEAALRSVRLTKKFVLYLDGIDIRPSSIGQEDYLECIKGLAHAVWEINTDFFANIKGQERNTIKCMLLIRPDIFSKVGLQNLNNKIRDNSVLLDWRTTYSDFEHSKIFKLADGLLAKQQSSGPNKLGEAWKYYFPYQIVNLSQKTKSDSSFIDFLRYSFYRPRDIVSMLDIMQKKTAQSNRNKMVFDEKDFKSSLSAYSNYLLGEIKDHLIFYYSDQDYEEFLKFFQYLSGRSKFSYKQFEKAYMEYIGYVKDNSIKLPSFFESPAAFLQFLYELNIICYVDESSSEEFIHWCFRERDYANINPKVKLHSTYNIHHGIARALDIGKYYGKDKARLAAATGLLEIE